MIAYIEIVRFYAGSHPLAKEKDLLIVHHAKKVWDCSRRVEQLGVRAGMSLVEARAILPEAHSIPYAHEDYAEAQRTWLNVCIECSNRIEPLEQHGAFLDCSGHPNPLEVVEKLLSALREKLGWTAKAALCKTKWVAQLAAQRQDPIAVGLGLSSPEMVFDARSYLADLPTELLSPVAPEHSERLMLLGYRTIGDVSEAPLEVLRGQFGEAGSIIAQASKGKAREPVQELYPPDSIQKQFVFQEPIESFDALNDALESLCIALATQLSERDLQGFDLAIVLQYEDQHSLLIQRHFSKPMHGVRSLLVHATLLLDEFKLRTDHAERRIASIRVILPHLVKAHRGQQTFSSLRSADERDLQAQEAIRRLHEAYGEGSIQVASERAEPRRLKVLRSWREATGWR